MTEIRKLVRDGKVGVVISTCFYESGWFTSHGDLQLLFLPELIELVESEKYRLASTYKYKGSNDITRYELIEQLLVKLSLHSPDLSYHNLGVTWIPVNIDFKVEVGNHVLEDYCDEVIVVNDGNWITA